MVTIIGREGYPQNGEVLAIVNYFLRSPVNEGGILIVGKDSQGKEYVPKNGQIPYSYALPSGVHYSVPVGSNPQTNYPALHFQFQLNSSRWQPRIENDTLEDTVFDDDFFGKFDLTLTDDSGRIISMDRDTEMTFKELAVWGAYEIKGLLKNGFWGERYGARTPELETFLEQFRA